MSTNLKLSKSAGGVVINTKGEILVVKQAGDSFVSWSLPKGRIDDGEETLETARREIYEESGISELELIKQLPSYQRHPFTIDGQLDMDELKTLHFFLFKTKQMELRPLDPDNPEARWIKKEEVSKLLTHPEDKKFFENIQKEIII